MSVKTKNHFSNLGVVHSAESHRAVLTRALYRGFEHSAAPAKVSLVEACLHEKLRKMARASVPLTDISKPSIHHCCCYKGTSSHK